MFQGDSKREFNLLCQAYCREAICKASSQMAVKALGGPASKYAFGDRMKALLADMFLMV